MGKNKKLLWVDDGVRLSFTASYIDRLRESGFDVIKFDWSWKDDLFERIKSLKPALILFHAGCIRAGEAPTYVKKFHKLGCKVIIFSASRHPCYNCADLVTQLLWGPDSLLDNVNEVLKLTAQKWQ